MHGGPIQKLSQKVSGRSFGFCPSTRLRHGQTPSRSKLDWRTVGEGMLVRTKRISKKLLRPLMSPWLTRRRIVADLRKLGLEPGGIALVHSSLSALGFVVGGAEAVIDALEEALGTGGTLLLPTHSWEAMEAGCRVFDVRQTPSCVGIISETFRAMHGSIRSLHPTHSVAAIGPRAPWIIAAHDQCTTPCGEG